MTMASVLPVPLVRDVPVAVEADLSHRPHGHVSLPHEVEISLPYRCLRRVFDGETKAALFLPWLYVW